METARNSTAGMKVDETACGAFCQHPACWQSNQRKEKGFPLQLHQPVIKKKEDIETSLPEVTVYNLLEDYGEDERDRFPSKHSGRSSEQKHEPLPALNFSEKSKGIISLSPLLTPECLISNKKKYPPKVKVLEVQELFDVEDLESRWDETFITKQCYVWVPNPRRKNEEKTQFNAITGGGKLEGGPIPAKDVTEQLVPEIIEREREETRLPFYTLPVIKSKKRLATRSRSPNHGRGRPSVKSSSYSHRVPFDFDGINDLLSLPSDVLMQVLDHLRDHDFMSKERIQDVIQDFQPPMVRDLTGLSIGTAEALQQKKISLLKDKKRNIRESHLMETRPVFQLDDGFVLDQISCVNTPVIELESDTCESPSLSIHGFSKYQKPLPAIGRLKGFSKKNVNKSKIASISLGLPELPTGIKHTKPFTYRKSDTMDLSIGPMPTPPTSDRSSSCGGSDHGTTLNVNIDTPTEKSSSKKHEIDMRFPVMPISPEPSDIPKAPVSTPDIKELSFYRDKTGASLKNPVSREHIVSPNQRVTVPVNSPTNSESGLRTIPEISAREHMTYPEHQRQLNPPAETQNTLDISEEVHKLTRELDSLSKIDCAEAEASNRNSTYSSPDPWPQVIEAVYTTPEESKDVNTPESNTHKSKTSHPGSELQSRESEQEQIARKMMGEAMKGTSPAPPPPSPEGKEFDRTPSIKPVSRESAFMEPLVEEENEDRVRGEDMDDPIDSEAMVTTVSEILPNPQSLIKEKSFHRFVNVDIPAADPTVSTDKDCPKLERSVQSFVSVDIPASTISDLPDKNTKIDKTE